MSTGLNTLSAAIYKDFVEHILPRKLSERGTHLSIKAISFGIGCFCIGVMFIVDKLGGILQVWLKSSQFTIMVPVRRFEVVFPGR